MTAAFHRRTPGSPVVWLHEHAEKDWNGILGLLGLGHISCLFVMVYLNMGCFFFFHGVTSCDIVFFHGVTCIITINHHVISSSLFFKHGDLASKKMGAQITRNKADFDPISLVDL